jgi:predicted transcriptional regulator
MCKLLLSINPEHVNNILDGTKRFEFRKTRCKERIDTIVIYSTSPVMKIVGEVEVTDILEGPPKSIWNRTYYAAGIDKDFYDQYFCGKQSAVAYALGTIRKYRNPLSLIDLGIKVAPQSYMYVRD